MAPLIFKIIIFGFFYYVWGKIKIQAIQLFLNYETNCLDKENIFYRAMGY